MVDVRHSIRGRPVFDNLSILFEALFVNFKVLASDIIFEGKGNILQSNLNLGIILITEAFPCELVDEDHQNSLQLVMHIQVQISILTAG